MFSLYKRLIALLPLPFHSWYKVPLCCQEPSIGNGWLNSFFAYSLYARSCHDLRFNPFNHIQFCRWWLYNIPCFYQRLLHPITCYCKSYCFFCWLKFCKKTTMLAFFLQKICILFVFLINNYYICNAEWRLFLRLATCQRRHCCSFLSTKVWKTY